MVSAYPAGAYPGLYFWLFPSGGGEPICVTAEYLAALDAVAEYAPEVGAAAEYRPTIDVAAEDVFCGD